MGFGWKEWSLDTSPLFLLTGRTVVVRCLLGPRGGSNPPRMAEQRGRWACPCVPDTEESPYRTWTPVTRILGEWEKRSSHVESGVISSLCYSSHIYSLTNTKCYDLSKKEKKKIPAETIWHRELKLMFITRLWWKRSTVRFPAVFPLCQRQRWVGSGCSGTSAKAYVKWNLWVG